MNTKSVSLSKAFSTGWNTFTKYPGVLIGGFLIYIAMVLVLEMIFMIPMILVTTRMPQSTDLSSPMFGVQTGFSVAFPIVVVFLFAPLVGGLFILLLNAVRDSNPGINDLFAGFRKYWKWVGLFFLYYLATYAAFIPELIGILVSTKMMHVGSAAAVSTVLGIAIMGLGIAISLVIMFILLTRWLFIYCAAADGAGIIESFGKSAEMTKGIRLPLFGILIVLWLFATAGIIACGIGVILTSIIASLAITSMYVDLKNQMSGTAPSASAPEPEPGQ